MRTPVLLLAHGSPIYSIKPSKFSEAWAKVGKTIPKPKAILMISAHWVTNETYVTDMDNPLYCVRNRTVNS
jgi:4,5-DOPA dioxygenase extradiol